MDNSTEKELGRVSLSKGAAAAVLGGICILILSIFFCIFAVTPAGNGRQNSQNSVKTDSLETAILRWRLYSENLKAVLLEQKTISLDSLDKFGPEYLSGETQEEKQHQDSLLEALVNEISHQ